jgi:hypothetical protein
MDIFDLAIPGCPERPSALKVGAVDKYVLRIRLRTIEKYYSTYVEAPDANLHEFKHGLRVIKYMIEDIVDNPEQFSISEALVLTELLKDLACVMVAGTTAEEFRRGRDILERLTAVLSDLSFSAYQP